MRMSIRKALLLLTFIGVCIISTVLLLNQPDRAPLSPQESNLLMQADSTQEKCGSFIDTAHRKQCHEAVKLLRLHADKERFNFTMARVSQSLLDNSSHYQSSILVADSASYGAYNE